MSETAIAQNLTAVRERIAHACAAANRDPRSVKLIAVSKKMPESAVRAAYAAGQRAFAENYAQELREKSAALADLTDIEWHFVGALQRNKVKMVVPTAVLLHSVDDVDVLKQIETVAARQNKIQHVLVQLNLSGESSKSGLSRSDLEPFLAEFAETPHVRCAGLMTMPAPDIDPAPYFIELRELAARTAEKLFSQVSLDVLSMGMTADLEIAIRSGSTMIRVGTAIFGERA